MSNVQATSAPGTASPSPSAGEPTVRRPLVFAALSRVSIRPGPLSLTAPATSSVGLVGAGVAGVMSR